MRLSDLKSGESAIVVKIHGHGAFRKRVMEMGFVRGRSVKCLLTAPLQDPVKYTLMGYEVSLRRSEGNLIEVVDFEEWKNSAENSGKEIDPTKEDDYSVEHDVPHDRIINVALIGNPNCGKTSLFNIAAGAHEHVGNYAGVTVGAKEGSLHYKGYKINIVDLPGTYSLSAYSPEELYVMRYLREETPDVIVNVAVASNLERNLFLTTELIEMNRSMVVCLNMYDEVKRRGMHLDYEALGGLLGVPMVPTSASKGEGINELLDTVISVYEMKNPLCRHIHLPFGNDIDRAVGILKTELKADASVSAHFAPRFLAIKLLQGDKEVERMLSSTKNYSRLCELRDAEVNRIERNLGEDVTSAIAAEKYGFVQGALRETFDDTPAHEEKSTRIIDDIVTSKMFGFPIFLALLWFMFWCTFQIGAYPMEWIENGVALLGEVLSDNMTDGPFKDLLIDGILGGVGGVIVFLPNILILYFFISFMEDSGYMARVAFIMDKLMHRIGLHGKSFIPLVMGFGCNVPAIMSTRIIESRSSRLITILINPFISCSARLPIYVLLIGIFFPHHGAWVFVALYLLGIIVAVITARLLRRFWFKKDETPFVMELPPYRLPTLKATSRAMWGKTWQYLRKMGGMILVASVIIWALSYFPRQEEKDLPELAIATGQLSETQCADMTVATDSVDTESLLAAYQQRESILGHIGRFVEPAVEPLGFDWKTAVSLIAGAGAKEIVVSTLGVLYTGNDSDEAKLSQRLDKPEPTTGEPPFTPLKAMAFMVFVLLYFPCIATITAIYRETGSWKYPLFSLVYNTAVAYLGALAVFRIGLLFV